MISCWTRSSSVGELLANLSQVRAGAVDDVAAAVDAAGDRLADRAQVFDRGEQLDQPCEPAVEPHAIAIERAGRGQRVGDLKELLGREHGADGGPADEQADVVHAAERRRLVRHQGLDHLGDEGEVAADLVDVARRLDAPGQLGPERRGGVLGQQAADLVELQKVEGVGSDRCVSRVNWVQTSWTSPDPSIARASKRYAKEGPIEAVQSTGGTPYQ